MKKKKSLLIIAVIISIVLVILVYNYLYNYKTYIKVSSSECNNLPDWIPVSDVDISEVSPNNIGFLSIPKFRNSYYIYMPIKESVEPSVLATSIGHFPQTPYNNGNICLAAHNSGTNCNGEYVGFFDQIKNLSTNDIIIYNHLSSTYKYKVISNKIILETNLSVLENTPKNQITLITCVDGNNKTYRRCVVAERI